MPDDPGGRPDKNSSHDVTSFTDKQEIVKEAGKNRMTFTRWAKESDVSKEKVLKYETLCNKEGEELTSPGLSLKRQYPGLWPRLVRD